MPNSNHVRVDILTGRQVVVAADREKRPIRTALPAVLQTDDRDPFLEGNESETPDERLALRKNGTAANQRGWLVRIVPNRYPAVSTSQDSVLAGTRPAATGFFEELELAGQHDVVVECPDSRSAFREFSQQEAALVLLAWQHRIRQIKQHHTFRYINVFRNEGAGAGASLPHCHSQITASNLATQPTLQRIRREETYRNEHGESLYERWLSGEIQSGSRVLSVCDLFAVLCPFASRFAWQTRFCPLDSNGERFENLREEEIRILASRVLSVARALSEFAPDVGFNLTLTLPPSHESEPFPWMLDLLPRPGRLAGFELMTDVEIVTVTPERAAVQYLDCLDWLKTAAGPLIPADYTWRPVPGESANGH